MSSLKVEKDIFISKNVNWFSCVEYIRLDGGDTIYKGSVYE